MSRKPTTTSDVPTKGDPTKDNVRAYEADAAELEAAMKLDAAVAGRLAAGADADAVFGELTEGGPNYRAVGWKCESRLFLASLCGGLIGDVEQLLRSCYSKPKSASVSSPSPPSSTYSVSSPESSASSPWA